MSFQMRKINNLRWTDDRIAIIKQYLKDKTLPNTISPSAKRRIINQFNNNDFQLVRNKIVYLPDTLNLEVVSKTDIQRKLNELYKESKTGIGNKLTIPKPAEIAPTKEKKGKRPSFAVSDSALATPTGPLK